MKTQKILSLILAIALVFSVGCVSAFAEEAKPLVFNTDGVLNLSDKGSFEADGEDGAIRAENGAKLTINGTDETIVTAKLEKEFTMAVWAKDPGTVVTINGGYYTNEGDGTDHVDLIYASLDANIVITGGTFKCDTPQWTLNCKDNSSGTITVKGGKFYQFDPSKANEKVAPTGDTEIVVPEGYSVVEKDGWYEVVSNAKVYNGGKETLELSGELVADGEDGAIQAKNGAKLTITGTDADIVKAAYVTEYTMAVWAHDANTEVTINGGYYTNEADPNDASQADLIYASADANIIINGGTFKCVTPKWTLNCNDKSNGTITVNGGKFYQFDPSNTSVAPAGKTEIVLGEGCTVVKNGDWYEVVKGGEASIAYDSTSSVANETEGALRFVFKVTIPAATETYFGAYLLPLDIFKASGVTKAVQVQYGTTEVKNEEKFSADLVKIPSAAFGKDIYAIPYIKTANGVEMFKGASASVNSASNAQ